MSIATDALRRGRFTNRRFVHLEVHADLFRKVDSASHHKIATDLSLGERLSTLMDQDSYSYTRALLWIGASSPRQLQRRHEQAVDIVAFELESVADE